MGLNRSMFKNLLNKIHILQNIYFKNKYLIKKKSYAMDGEDLAIDQYIQKKDKGFYAIMDNFNYERYMMGAQMLGMSQRCFDECVSYAKERNTFGKALIEHQVIRHKLADMSAKIDAMDAYLNQVAQLMNDGEKPVAEISKIKFYCSECLESIASEAMQILGGTGYLRGNPVERIYREVKVMAIGGGSKEIMKDLTVKQMGL